MSDSGPPESFQAFSRGLHEIFAQWSAFRIIREHGEDYHRCVVLDDLEADTLFWFQQEGEIYPDTLSEYFDRTIKERLRTDLEDGSAEEVGRMLHSMYNQCIRGDFSGVRQLIASGEAMRQVNAPAPVQIVVVYNSDDDEESGSGTGEGGGEGNMGGEGGCPQLLPCEMAAPVAAPPQFNWAAPPQEPVAALGPAREPRPQKQRKD